MNCPICGTPLPPNATECPNCGAVVDWDKSAEATPVTVKDTATIRRQALIRMAVELVHNQAYDAALLIYRKVLKGLKPGHPQYQDIQQHMARIQHTLDTQNQQAQLNLQRYRLLSVLAGHVFLLKMQQGQQKSDIPEVGISNDEQHSPKLVSDSSRKQPENTDTPPSAPLPSRFWVKWPIAYIVGLSMTFGFSQLLQTFGFGWQAQTVLALMLLWAAYAGRQGLLALEWFSGFAGAYFLSGAWSDFALLQWISLALESFILDALFFYAANWNLTAKIFIGMLFAGFVFFITPLFPLSILQALLQNYPYAIAFIALLFLLVSRKPGAWFQRWLAPLCLVD